MTRREQRRFVRGLIRNVEKDLLENIDRVPDHWDGHELRRWIADRFDAAAFTIGPHGKTRHGDDRARAKAYRNDVIVHNL